MIPTPFLLLAATSHAPPAGSFRPVQNSTTAAECLSHIKQLGLSTLMYMNDHNDKFIPKSEDVHKALAPYTKLKAVWNCPETGKPAYTLNANLLGKAATTIVRPDETVMLYEGKGGKLDYRHEGRDRKSVV